MKDKIIYSPLYRQGSKRRIIKRVLSEMQYASSGFVDMFGGSGIVVANMPSNRHRVYNDKAVYMREMFDMLRDATDRELQIYFNFIEKNCNKESFNRINQEYNDGHRDPLRLWYLSACSFSHLIKFNKDGNYSNTFANRKDRDRLYSFDVENLKQFRDAVKGVCTCSCDFEDCYVQSGWLVYCDPPYIKTGAEYNKGWNDEDLNRLLNWLDVQDRKGVKFCLSELYGATPELKEFQDRFNTKTFINSYSQMGGVKFGKESITKNF